ncbi:hypothetical protein EZV62_018928 [Acer yangbiense]|uniref:Uncharacterized protein n=1 Tax=Acer yangbiense TaxID=1000413 RepID=A0A5C7HAX6_9ROSI|nr:hypothetical protein EZV62_018928 [Acer yangbiense]
MEFLQGIHDRFSAIHSQILLMDPFPSVARICSLVRQEEKQQEIHTLSNAIPEAAALNFQRETCYKIYGYPPKNFHANAISAANAPHSAARFTFTMDQYSKLLKVGQNSSMDPQLTLKTLKMMATELVPKIEEADFFRGKVTCLSSLMPVYNIILKLTAKQRKMFECTCFGRLLEMDELVFSSQTVHELLLREAKSPNTDEIPYPSVDVDKRVKCVGLIDGLLNGDMNLYNNTLEDVFMNASSNDGLTMLQVYAFLQPIPEEEQQCYFQLFNAPGASKDQPTLMHNNTTSAASSPSSDVNATTDTMAIKKSVKRKPPLKLLLELVVALKKYKRNHLPSRRQEISQEQGLASLLSTESPMPSLDEAQAFFSELKPILDESLENLLQSSLAMLDSP